MPPRDRDTFVHQHLTVIDPGFCAHCGLVWQDAAALRGRVIQGPVFGMTYKGRFSPWDLFMLRGSNGKRTSYNKCAHSTASAAGAH